jgi:hypothetical protein
VDAVTQEGLLIMKRKLVMSDVEKEQADAWRAAGWSEERIEQNIRSWRLANAEAHCTEPIPAPMAEPERATTAR